MKPTLYIFVPGIRSNPENVLGWWALAEAFVDNAGIGVAESYAYKVHALDRWLYQKKHVRNVWTKIGQREFGRLVLVGHSNGAAIICDLLKTYSVLPDEIHLIAGAADADYRENGLNAAVWRGIQNERPLRIFLYCSESDFALEAGSWSKKALGWLGLGYGSIGRTGPENQTADAAYATTIIQRNGFGHSTWFRPEHFYDTMRLVTEGPVKKP